MSLTSYRAAPPRVTSRGASAPDKNAAARESPTAAIFNIMNGFCSKRWLQSLATTYSSTA